MSMAHSVLVLDKLETLAFLGQTQPQGIPISNFATQQERLILGLLLLGITFMVKVAYHFSFSQTPHNALSLVHQASLVLVRPHPTAHPAKS
jgi:hypothetical protein